MEVAMISRENQTPHYYPVVELVLDGIADWVKQYRQAVDARSEFAHCTPDEVKAMAKDLGMTPSDLRTLADQGPEAADLLKRMLVALKVDPKILGNLDPRISRNLQRSCITCGEKRRCRHELTAGTAVRNMHEYCPNALTLKDIFDAVNSRTAQPH
jgi:hypothetical protein